ncbi:MAG TPA: metallophosphoesterase family protein, partial [bacterium]
MKTAIISDIHSNISALTSVLSKIDSLKCDRIVCLGDIVGYAADPNECTSKIREVSTLTIRGNH